MLKHLLLASFLSIAAAARNCSAPDFSLQSVNWQSGSCYRGTWTLVSSCLTTIVACTWTIQHLNIPASSDSPWTKFGRKLKWMLITVLFPEIILVHAGFQLRMAWKALEGLEREKKRVRWPWYKRLFEWPWYTSLFKGLREKWPWYTALWKWLRSKFGKQLTDEESGEKTQGNSAPPKEWTMTHCYYANMGGFIYDNGNQRFRLTAGELLQLDESPEIAKEDIQDKSKQDWLAKTWAGLQILQLILSVITRHIQHVPFSQLEMVTLSFAVCGVVIYMVNIHRPQNISRATNLKEKAGKIDPSMVQTQDRLWELLSNRRNEVVVNIAVDSASSLEPPRIPNDSIPFDNGSNIVHPVVYPLAGVSVVFGVIHAIAWSFEFPTPEEKLVWRIATAISAVSPVLGLLTIPLAQTTQSAGEPELFVAHTLRLMREYRWHYPRRFPVNNAIRDLENGLKGLLSPGGASDKRHAKYSNIFTVDSPGADSFLEDVGNFLHLRDPYENVYNKAPNALKGDEGRVRVQDQNHQRLTKGLDLHEDEEFIRNFDRLVDLFRQPGGKKLEDEARTDMWPRKPKCPAFLNDGILYGTSVLYCLSRLALLAVAFSSLRKMPGMVYMQTDWTGYVPSFGAKGG